MRKSVVFSLLGFTLLFAGCTPKEEKPASESTENASATSLSMTSSTEVAQESTVSSSEAALPVQNKPSQALAEQTIPSIYLAIGKRYLISLH